MKVMLNESISKHTTIRIGGDAKIYLIPQNLEELISCIVEHRGYKIISGGSNILANDNAVFECVIDMHDCCREFYQIEDNQFYIGASLPIQKVIRELQAYNRGGFEFLYSLPALFGGTVTMNAGRGADKRTISDYIKSVRFLDNKGYIQEFDKSECCFSNRHSVFQDKDYIVLGAVIECDYVDSKESKARVQERITFSRTHHDLRFPNCGSIFSYSNARIMSSIRLYSKAFKLIKRNNGLIFSDRCNNWIINLGHGTYSEAIRLIAFTERVHRMLNKRIEREIVIWE